MRMIWKRLGGWSGSGGGGGGGSSSSSSDGDLAGLGLIERLVEIDIPNSRSIVSSREFCEIGESQVLTVLDNDTQIVQLEEMIDFIGVSVL